MGFIAFVAVALLVFFAITALKAGDLNDFANLVRDWWNGLKR